MRGARLWQALCLAFVTTLGFSETIPGQTSSNPVASSGGKPRVLVRSHGAEQVEELRRDIPDVEILTVESDAQLEQEIGTVDAIIGKVTPELIRKAPRLRWVQVTSGGVDTYMFPEMVDSDIILTNAKIVHGPEISEHAIALLLTLTHNLHKAVRSQMQEHWDEDRGQYDDNTVLEGKTALVIGMGGIGTGIAEKAFGLGMRVLAVDPKDLSYIRAVERVYKPDQLHEVLPEADMILIAAPLTPETKGMLGPDEFKLMKDGVYLVNVSRGKIVDVDALVEGLRSGKVKAAGVDVIDPEPLPKGHPLWKMDNFLMTPHIAGRSEIAGPREFGLIKDNVRRFAKGLPLYNIVNKQVGY